MMCWIPGRQWNEAQKALTASFVAYETNSNNVENVCADVGGEKISSLPDMCMPDSEYEPIKYRDTREKGGRNHPKDLSPNPKFGDVRTGNYLGYKIQPKTRASRKVYAELCASKAAGASFKSNAMGDNKFGSLASSTSWQYFGVSIWECLRSTASLRRSVGATLMTRGTALVFSRNYWPKRMIPILDTSGSMSQKVKVSNINNDGEEILVKWSDCK